MYIYTNQMEKIIAKTTLNVKLLKSILRYKNTSMLDHSINLPFEVFQLKNKANCDIRMRWGFFQIFEFVRKLKFSMNYQ